VKPTVRETLNLVWLRAEGSIINLIFNIKKQEVDIEAGLGHEEMFDLRTYPVFLELLAKNITKNSKPWNITGGTGWDLK